MKSIIIACAVAAGSCLCAGAQPMAVTLHPEACAPVATADGPAHLLSAPGHNPGQTARRPAPRKAAGEDTWNFKNYDSYQKVGDEWVQVRSTTREIDPVTGYVVSELTEITYGNYPDDLHKRYERIEYEYDEYGRTILSTVYEGDTPEAMTPVKRDITEYFEDTTTDTYPRYSYSQTTADNGVTWEDVPNSRTTVERDNEGRVNRVARYYYTYDDAGVRVPVLESDAAIVYGADNRPTAVTVQNGNGSTREIRDMEWASFDPTDIYLISWLHHRWLALGNSWCSHAVFTDSREGEPTRTFSSDMTIDGATGTVNYTRILEGEEKPTQWNEVKEGTYVHCDCPGDDYNTYTSEIYYVPGEDWYQYWEQLNGNRFVPVVHFTIDNRSIYPTGQDSDGNSVYSGFCISFANEITYHEDSGMVHEYITPGETDRGSVDIVGEGLSWYVDKPLSEWPEFYDVGTTPDTAAPYRRVYTNWVKASDAIDAVEVDNSACPVEWYTVDGCRVANPSAGIFIRRQGRQAEKVMLK